MRMRALRVTLTLVGCLVLAAPAAATWSIIIVDTHSQEVAIGSATCLQFFNLQRGLPVVRPRRGAGAAQSFIDSTGQNRLLIWRELLNGTDPADMLGLLEAQDGGHQTRQYGIVDVQGRAVTFSGTQNGAYANGLTGQIGTLVYAIQGNVITGQPVLEEAERALRKTPGGIPEKLMAAMEAARAMGGDGRCSCLTGPPPSCGSPPPDFARSAIIGFMISARRGDPEGACHRSAGCANGIYYMGFNVTSPSGDSRDPVIQLREQFDTWRDGLVGIPDAVVSRATLSRRNLPNDGTSTAELMIEVLDWRGEPVNDSTVVFAIHDWDGSAETATISPLQQVGDNAYEAVLTAGTTTGLNHILVGVQHGGELIFFMPSPQLLVHHARGDLNGDGAVNKDDINPFFLALGNPDAFAAQFPDVAFPVVGDLNGDGGLDAEDIDGFFALLGG